MKKLERDKMYNDILAHGKKLLAIFPSAKYQNPVLLCKVLRRLEYKAEQYAVTLCNGGTDRQLTLAESGLGLVEKQLKEVLNATDNQVFINRDPRGYALKLTSEFSADKDIYKDLGSYGIISPDFTPNKY